MTLDFDGTPRVAGGGLDVGAVEIAPYLPGTGEDLVLATYINGGNGASPA